MPPLTPYSRTYSFTDYQSGNPSAPLPGVQVDNELENIEQSLGEAIDAIGDIRRSDGKLNNGVVTVDSLSPQVAAGVGAGALAAQEAAEAAAAASAASATAAAGSATAASGYAGNALTSRNEASDFADDSAAAASLSQTARDYANKWATEAEDVNVDDGVNPVGRSAYHWSQKAAASAASVDLPPIVADTLPGGNAAGDAWETKTPAEVRDLVVTDGSLANVKLADVPTATFKGRATAGTGAPEDLTTAQARDLLDPLRGFNADGATDDTANWAALRLAYPLDDIDCKGAEYLITGDPADYGPTHNGYWVKADYEGNIDVRIPMRGTMETARTTLTTGSGYAAWCQDNWGVHRGEVMAIWNEGGDHASGDDMNGVSMRLKNGIWTQKESILRDPTADYWISGGLVLDGVQYILRRTDSTNEYKLYMRHLSERFEFTDILNCGGTPGAKAFYINLSDIPAEYGMIGAREGMKAIFTSVDVIGGNAISGEYAVNFINGTRIQWLHASDFSGEVLLAGGEFSVTFVESDWIECNIGGVQISDAIDAKWVADGGPHLHSTCIP